MATFEKSLVKKLKEEEKEDEVPKASEAMAMGFMALGDAISGASGVSTNYLGSYLKNKRARKKKTSYEGLKELRLLRSLKLQEKRAEQEDMKLDQLNQEKKLKQNLSIAGSTASIEKHQKMALMPKYQKAKQLFEQKNPGKKFEEQEATLIQPYINEVLELEKRKYELEKLNKKQQTAIAKEERDKEKTREKNERQIEKDKDREARKQLTELNKDKDKKWSFWEGKRDQIQKSLFQSVFSQLKGVVNPNFSLDDLIPIGNKVFYTRKYVDKDGQKQQENIEVQIPIKTTTSDFLDPAKRAFGMSFPVGYQGFNQAFDAIINQTLKERSGAAVTQNEFNRLKAEFGTDFVPSASGIIRALKNLDKDYKTKIKRGEDVYISNYGTGKRYQEYLNAGFGLKNRVKSFNPKREGYKQTIESVLNYPGISKTDRDKMRNNWMKTKQYYEKRGLK